MSDPPKRQRLGRRQPDHHPSAPLTNKRQRLDHLSLIPTTPPYWASMTQQQWLRRTDGQPLRLLISCRLADYVWELAYDVPVNVEPR